MVSNKRKSSVPFLQSRLDWIDKTIKQLTDTPVNNYKQMICDKPLFRFYYDIRPVVRHESVLNHLEPDIVITKLEGTDLIVMYLAYLPDKVRCLITKDILDKKQITPQNLFDESTKQLVPGHFLSYAYNDGLADINITERYNATYDANAILCSHLLKTTADMCKSAYLILVPAAVTQWHLIAATRSEADNLKEELHKKLHAANTNRETVPLVKLSDSLYLYDKTTDKISILYQGDTDLYTNGGPMS